MTNNKKMVNTFIILGIIGAIIVAVALGGYQYFSSKTVRDGFEGVSNEATDNKNEIISAIKLTELEKNEIRSFYIEKLKSKDQDIELANKTIDELLDKIEHHDKSDDQVIVKAYNYFATKEFDKAIRILDAELIKRNEEKTADLRILKGDLNLIEFNWQDALENYKKAANIFPSIKTKFKLINLYENLNMYREATNEYELILNDKTFSSELNDAILSNVYNNLGTMYTSIGDLDKAQNYLQKCLKIRENDFKSKDLNKKSDYAKTLVNISQIKFKKGITEGALTNINSAIKYQRELIIEDERKYTNDLIPSLINKAVVLSSKDKFNEALQVYNELEKIINEYADKYDYLDSPSYISTLLGRANLFHNLGMYDYSINDNRIALNHIDEIIYKNPMQYELMKSKILSNLGNSHKEKNEIAKATEVIKESISILEKYYNQDKERFHSLFNQSEENLGGIYLKDEKFQLALSIYNKSLSNNLSFYGKPNKQNKIVFARTYFNLGCCYEGLEKNTEAIEMFNKSKKLLLGEKDIPITVQLKIEDMNKRIAKLSKK